MKRPANIPAACLGDCVSKADLLEAAWHLASLCNDSGSADDDASTFKRLVHELNTLRAARGARPVQLPARFREGEQ